ncbi:Serine/threonine-protein phosphatase 7 long form [Glycine max]|nr:Serine/threonine-protein phosphatase 7 long form [Glycine max]
MEARNTYVSHEMRRVYDYSLRCLRVDGVPLIGLTNLDCADLCEELLGVRPQEGELQGSVVKLSWLAQHFLQLNNCDGDVVRRGNHHIGNNDRIVFHRKLDIMKRHESLWESYTTTVTSALPPICLVESVAWCAVVPLICFHVVEWHQPDRVLR